MSKMKVIFRDKPNWFTPKWIFIDLPSSPLTELLKRLADGVRIMIAENDCEDEIKVVGVIKDFDIESTSYAGIFGGVRTSCVGWIPSKDTLKKLKWKESSNSKEGDE